MRASAAMLLAVAAALLGCADPRSSAGPPTIHYGEEECSMCRMLVGDERHASAITSPSGAVERFDDLRCLLRYLEEREMEPGTRVWVHAENLDWVPAREAWFAISEREITPMGSGLAAFAQREAAVRFAGSGPEAAAADRVLGWVELRAAGSAGLRRPSQSQQEESS